MEFQSFVKFFPILQSIHSVKSFSNQRNISLIHSQWINFFELNTVCFLTRNFPSWKQIFFIKLNKIYLDQVTYFNSKNLFVIIYLTNISLIWRNYSRCSSSSVVTKKFGDEKYKSFRNIFWHKAKVFIDWTLRKQNFKSKKHFLRYTAKERISLN